MARLPVAESSHLLSNLGDIFAQNILCQNSLFGSVYFSAALCGVRGLELLEENTNALDSALLFALGMGLEMPYWGLAAQWRALLRLCLLRRAMEAVFSGSLSRVLATSVECAIDRSDFDTLEVMLGLATDHALDSWCGILCLSHDSSSRPAAVCASRWLVSSPWFAKILGNTLPPPLTLSGLVFATRLSVHWHPSVQFFGATSLCTLCL